MSEQKRKIRLLAYTSSPVAPTGFGICAKEILLRLHMTGLYDIQVIAIDFRPGDKHDFPVHLCITTDPWGIHKLQEVVRREKFDVFFIMQDIHVFGLPGQDPGRKMPSVVDIMNNTQPTTPIVTLFPVDRYPLPFIYIDSVLRKCDLNFVKSNFGKEQVIRAVQYYGGNPIHIDTIHMGANTTNFYPIPEDVRTQERKKAGWENKFVIANINRFQPRKNLPATLRAAHLFGEGYNVCANCGNYFSLWDKRCDLCYSPHICERHQGVSEMVLYLHMNNIEHSMGSTKLDWLNNHVACSGFSNKSGEMVIISNRYGKGGFDQVAVNMMYNLSDVFLTTTFGEGAGLTTLEALATGTPTIAPLNSSLMEYIGRAGTLIPCVGHVSFSHDMGSQRPLVSVPRVVDALHVEYQKWLANGRKKVINEEALKHVQKFSWEDCVRKLHHAFTSVLGKRTIYCGVKKL